MTIKVSYYLTWITSPTLTWTNSETPLARSSEVTVVETRAQQMQHIRGCQETLAYLVCQPILNKDLPSWLSERIGQSKRMPWTSWYQVSSSIKPEKNTKHNKHNFITRTFLNCKDKSFLFSPKIVTYYQTLNRSWLTATADNKCLRAIHGCVSCVNTG